MAKVKEGTTSHHPFSLLKYDGSPVGAPEALRYKVVSDEGAQIVDWTNVDIDATEIVVAAEANIIGDNGVLRYLTIEATHSGGEKITSEIKYMLVDLKGI